MVIRDIIESERAQHAQTMGTRTFTIKHSGFLHPRFPTDAHENLVSLTTQKRPRQVVSIFANNIELAPEQIAPQQY